MGKTIWIVDCPVKVDGIIYDYYGEGDLNDELLYPGINSCLAVATIFDDGSKVGVHLVEYDNEYVGRINKWIELTTNKGQQIFKVIIAGPIGGNPMHALVLNETKEKLSITEPYVMEIYEQCNISITGKGDVKTRDLVGVEIEIKKSFMSAQPLET
jgi:hypothetical protein